jgi:hypothetical protein
MPLAVSSFVYNNALRKGSTRHIMVRAAIDKYEHEGAKAAAS